MICYLGNTFINKNRDWILKDFNNYMLRPVWLQGLYHTSFNVPWGDCYLKTITIKKGIMKTTKKSMCALYEKHEWKNWTKSISLKTEMSNVKILKQAKILMRHLITASFLIVLPCCFIFSFCVWLVFYLLSETVLSSISEIQFN